MGNAQTPSPSLAGTSWQLVRIQMFSEHQGEAQVTWLNLELKCKERK
jgi:hypothetical protein